MACNPEKRTQDTSETSSDEESLATVKRKLDENSADGGKRYKTNGASDMDPLLPDIQIKIEIEEMIEPGNRINFTTSSRSSKQYKDPDIHKNWKPPKRKKSLKCSDCKAVFRTPSELKTHSLQHQMETRHKCEECGRFFKNAFALRTHRRMHGERNIKCPLCDAVFTLNVNLGSHMRHHPKNFKCSECQAAFHTQKELDKHSCGILLKAHQIKTEENTPETSATGFKISVRNTKDLLDESKYTITTDAVKTEFNSDESTDEVNETNEGDESKEVLKKDDLSYTTQCAIVSKMHKGRSVADICEIYNLTPEIVNEIWEQREEFVILKRASRNRRYMNKILDSKLLGWWNRHKESETQVSGKMLTRAAETFANECGFISFNGSKKWLDRFKKRYNITFRTAPLMKSVENVPLESKSKKTFLEEQWPDARNGMADEDIYTADEVGLYYNPSRGRIKKLAGKKFVHGLPKDRLAIFMCTNITGSDKKKLLVCGTDDPLMYSHRNPDTLPVMYVRHSQAHFTTPMFEEFVKFWNQELQLRNKKAILILDRATIHSKLTLSNLKLIFVPWKSSTSLMPIKNGIFNKFRDEFRKLLLLEKAANVKRGVDRNVTCLEALNMLEKAWDRTPTDIISKSFYDVGFDIDIPSDFEHKTEDSPKVTAEDEEVLCEMLKTK